MPILPAEELTYTKLRALDMSRTICFQPVSALEVHGPHLPLGMDYYMARWMAEETGRRFAQRHPDWTVVQYPALPLGTDELPLAGSMNTNQRTIFRAVRDHGSSLAAAGYRYIVITNGHGGPRHAAALEAACREVSRKHRVHMFTPSIKVLHDLITGQKFAEIEASLGRVLTDDERDHLRRGEHAGTWETSFMLAQNPDLVEPTYRELEYDEAPKFAPLLALGRFVMRAVSRFGGDPEALRLTWEGLAQSVGWLLNARYGYGGKPVSYHGTPAAGSAEIGRAFRDVMAAECLACVERVTTGATDAVAVRSVASDPAIIQPHFWPRVAAALAVLGLLFLW